MTNFDIAFIRTMRWEGGGELHEVPGDPGGRTKWGISQRAHPDVNVVDLTKDEAKAIYARDYWDPMHCDDIPSPEVAQYMFDTAVNFGVSTASRLLQQVVGVKTDGRVGPQTIAAVTGALTQGSRLLLNELRIARAQHYLQIVLSDRDKDKFLLGWMRRALS